MKYCNNCKSAMADNINFCTVCGNDLNIQKKKRIFTTITTILASVFTGLYIFIYVYLVIILFVIGLLLSRKSMGSHILESTNFLGLALFSPPLIFLPIIALIFSALSLKVGKKLLIFNIVFLGINLAIILICKFVILN